MISTAPRTAAMDTFRWGSLGGGGGGRRCESCSI